MRLPLRISASLVLVVAASVAAGAVGSGPPLPGSPGGGDPYFPMAGNGGYDVAAYRLKLAYDPDTDRLDGVARIRAKATQNLSRFNFDLDGLTVRSVAVDGRRASWEHDDGELMITPARALRTGRHFRTVIRYGGVPVQVPYGPGVITTDDGAVILGEPAGASTWYPVNDHPSDKARFTVKVTVPQGLEAISNGALRSARRHDGRTTWTWHAAEPMAPYLASVSMGEFLVDSYRADGLRYWDAIDPELFVERAPSPRSGTQLAWSQQTGDGASYKRLARTIDVPAGGADLSFWIHRATEELWDFVFVEARPVGTDDWTTLRDQNGHTSQDTGLACPFWHADHPFLAHYQSDLGDGSCDPTGSTGEWWAATGAGDGWEPWRVDLAGYAGQQVEVAITYASDEVIQEAGVFIDDVVVSTGEGSTSFEADGDPLDGWTVPGPPDGSPANENDWVATSEVDLVSLGEQVRASFDRQPEMIRTLAGMFGPYPFATAGGVVDHADLWFALEIQTRPVYSPGFWQFGAGNDVVVHELAHQWYGNHVAVARWRDIWLNEGFATYAEWLWHEKQGTFSAQEIFDFFYADIPEDDAFWDLEIGDPGPDALFAWPIYVRGAMTLHALRIEIGDRRFFRVLRAWAAEEGNRRTGQLVRLAERIAGRQLDALFRTWLHTGERPGHPAGGPRSAARGGSVPAPAKSLLTRLSLDWQHDHHGSAGADRPH